MHRVGVGSMHSWESVQHAARIRSLKRKRSKREIANLTLPPLKSLPVRKDFLTERTSAAESVTIWTQHSSLRVAESS